MGPSMLMVIAPGLAIMLDRPMTICKSDCIWAGTITGLLKRSVAV